MRTAYVNTIESFGNVDGPGIRFVLFLQGCPLRCKYCHNRDSWAVHTGREMSVEQVMKEVLKYREFFDASGGGITVSGGEPLLQIPFIIELFKACKQQGIHTNIDTSGFLKLTEKNKILLDELMVYTDMMMLDIKLMDEENHQALIGVSNELILDFGRYVASKGMTLWIRRVLVPGLTDSEEDLQATAAYIKSLGSVKRIDVLPYHPMGEPKWAELGYEYPLKGQRTPTKEEIAKAEAILKL